MVDFVKSSNRSIQQLARHLIIQFVIPLFVLSVHCFLTAQTVPQQSGWRPRRHALNVAVTVSPTTASLQAGQQSQFTATVSGTNNKAVTWTASGGTVTSGGQYTAPSSAGTYKLTATSVADSSESACAVVTVNPATANPVTVTSASLSPATVVGGSSSTGTVTLSGAAPAGGALVTLTSNNAAAQVGASVTVTAGAKTATFPVTTSTVATTTSSSISATYNSSTKSAALTVNPVTVAVTMTSVSLTPATVVGGSSSTGTVTLSAAAPAGGVLVTLASNSAAAQVGASVTVAAGTKTATFPVTTSTVATTTTAAISATYNSSTQSATLTVSQPSQISISISPGTASLQTGGQQQFTAYVSGTSNTAVTWSASSGTVTTSGLYVAPSAAGTYTVTAVSAADPTKSTSATVSVSAATAIAVSISPTAVALSQKSQQQFAATVSGSSNTAVTWAVTQGTGTITQSGLYTAPQAVETDIVVVTSQADSTKSASASITVAASHSVALSWSPSSSSSISYYDAYRGTVSGGPYTLLATDVTSTSYTDSNVQSGSTYYYVTTAVESNGEQSAYSNEVQAVIPTP